MSNIIKNLFSEFNNANKDNTSININTQTSHKNEVNHARELLKEATKLKRDKKFGEACDKLKEAYSVDGSEELMTKERLRLPMYLQLAGKNDEGWKILNELNITYTDAYSQSDIANQMRVFLQKERKYKHSVIFGAWCICKNIECYQFNIDGLIAMADEMVKLGMDDSEEFAEDDEIYAYTPNGNPITNKLFKLFQERIETATSLDGVKNNLLPMLKKAKLAQDLDRIAMEFSQYLKKSTNYDFTEVRDYFNEKFE